jgi:hypothetical protein
LLAQTFKLLRREWYVSHANGMPSQYAGHEDHWERERGACTVSPWNTLAADDIHP